MPDSDDSIEIESAASAIDTGSFLRIAARIADVDPAGVDRDRTGGAIGPFAIRKKVGQGGMGVVYEAQDVRDCSKVALKVLPMGLLSDPAYAGRFAAEAEALASLDHPGIVRHIAHGTSTAGEPYLAMEWLDGEDLASRLGRMSGEPPGLSVGDCMLLGRCVADALAAAHARGIIHRDIKPSNLFLCCGRIAGVKVLDFGIARVEQAAQVFTATGSIIGTPGYMAPEQARGDRSLDARADIFSLGAVLFECLSGRQAFLGGHPLAILAKLLLDEPRLGELRPDLPARLVALVERMLSKDPAARPESAKAVALELDGIAECLASSSSVVDTAARTMLAPAAEGTRSEAVRMSAEKRLLCIVAARVASDPGNFTPTGGTGTGVVVLDQLKQEGAALGMRVEQLVDGSLLATLTATGNAMDQVAKAARFALLLRRIAPALSIALATGLDEVSDRVPVGPVVDRAAELIRAAGRAIRLDDTTAAMLESRFEVTAAPPELVGEHEFGEGVRKLLGRPSPCVGRERELRALGEILSECIDEGVARPVLVTAPAGAGKSRMRHEFLQAVKLRGGVDTWLGRGDPMRAGSAFSLISSALSTAADLRTGEALPVRRQRLAARAGRHMSERERVRVAAFLGEICGTPFEDDACSQLREARRNSAVMVDEIHRAWEDFITTECAACPLLIVLEDVHWGDAQSLKLIDSALRKAKDQPLMVLALSRPDIHDLFPKLWSDRGVQEIRLPELTRRAAEKLVRHALGDRIDPGGVARIVERAGGHAFYLEELIRAVAAGQAGALPETVLAMVQSRLDGLGPELRRVLRAASIFGETFWESGVLALLGENKDERADTRLIDLLVDREIFTRYRDETRFPGEAQFAFRHALLRDGAYAMLTEGDLATGHRLAAEWLEKAGEADATVLAEHFDRGGERLRASVHYLRAAEGAIRVGDFTASAARAERGLQCGVEGELRMELLRVVGESLAMSGDWERAMPHADEILRHTRPGSRAFCSALAGKLIHSLQVGHSEYFVEAMALCRDLVPTPDNAGLLTQLFSELFVVLAFVEQSDLAQHYYERMLHAAEIGKHSEPNGLGNAHWARHIRAIHWDANPWDAIGAATDGRAEFERSNDFTWALFMRSHLAATYGCLGVYARAEELLRADVGATGRDSHAAAAARAYLAHTLAERGALDEAELHARKLVADAHALRDQSREQGGRAVLARVHLARGALDGAETEASLSLELAMQVPMMRVELRGLLAAIHLAQGRLPEALEAAREAIEMLAAMKCRPLQEAFIRLTYVDVLWAAGERDRAADALRAARDQLLAIAARIPDEPLRKSFLENVAVNARTLALAAERLGSAAAAGP